MIDNSCNFFHAGDIKLESGEVLPEAKLGYTTFGELNTAGDNAVLVLTHFGGTHENSQYLVGSEMALDPSRYFIVIVNLFGNGASSSPSHGMAQNFPTITMADNVFVQQQLLLKELGVKKLALVVGHSMGGVATYHWAALFPEWVERAAPICGAAKISDHNWVFLEGMRAILTMDPAWLGGMYEAQPIDGLRSIAKAWAAWPPSAGFYRQELYRTLGYSSLEDYLLNYWEKTYLSMDANNVLAQINTWQSANIGKNRIYGDDFIKALSSVSAKVYVMPSSTDAYFPPEDSRNEVSFMPAAELRTIKSEWGHWAGSGRCVADTTFINKQLLELLET